MGNTRSAGSFLCALGHPASALNRSSAIWKKSRVPMRQPLDYDTVVPAGIRYHPVQRLQSPASTSPTRAETIASIPSPPFPRREAAANRPASAHVRPKQDRTPAASARSASGFCASKYQVHVSALAVVSCPAEEERHDPHRAVDYRPWACPLRPARPASAAADRWP